KEKRKIVSGRGGHLRPTFSPEGKTLAAGSALWDVSTGKRVRKMQGNCLGPFVISPNGKVLTSVQGRINLWDTATGRALLRFDHERHDSSPGGEVCFSPDGSLLA